jgi:hypothetical protein
MKDKIHSILVLIRLLNGNTDLPYYIIELEDKQKQKDAQNYWIENNFYNWLNHDIVIRKSMRLDMTELYNYYKNDLYKYYEKYSGILGLVNYRRKKKLTECFNNQWWKCTPKSFIYWKGIHNVISSKIKVFEILQGYDYDEIDINYYFDNDLLIEKNGITKFKYINFIYNEYLKEPNFLIEDISYVFLKEGKILFTD